MLFTTDAGLKKERPRQAFNISLNSVTAFFYETKAE